MRFPHYLLKVGVLLCVAALTACGTISGMLPDRRVEYKQSHSIDPLEVPPDLTSASIQEPMGGVDLSPTGSATFSQYAGERSSPTAATHGEAVLTTYDSLRIERDGDQRWLVVQAEPSQVWPRMREFWLQEGFLVVQEDAAVGVLETEWAENRADIPQDGIRRMIGRVLDSVYSASTRDKYRVRLERGQQPGTTELYLSHRGAEEVVKGESTIWQSRDSDPELEAEMLHRLMVHLGEDERRARTLVAERGQDREPRAQLTQDAEGQAFLVLDEEFFRAWRRTGLALDRVGFTVEDRDRSEGVYFVRYNDPMRETRKQGVLSRWFGRGGESAAKSYRINLLEQDETTRIVVLDDEGNRESSRTAVRILTLLHEQLQ